MTHRNLHFYMTREQMCEIAVRPKMTHWYTLRDEMDAASGGELSTEDLDLLTNDLEAIVISLRSVLGLLSGPA